MLNLFRRGIRFLARKLIYLGEINFSYTEFKRMRDLKKKGIHYSRYFLFNKPWLLDYRVKNVIDVGANVGEFTAIFAELFPEAQIYAFEPLPDCFTELQQIAERYEKVKIFNLALGNSEESCEFNKSSWAPASSLRSMGELHKQNYPHSARTEKVNVPIKQLDRVLEGINLSGNTLIKIDVQGFEDEVIKGGRDTIGKAKVLIIECSFKSLYENEPMFHGIYSLVHSLGFEYRGSIKQSVNKKDGSYLQADCIFIKD